MNKKKKFKNEIIRRLKADLIAVTVKAYPQEEGWYIRCPKCGKRIHIRLVWDNQAFEYQLILEH